MSSSFDLTGKTALITGGAGILGRRFATALAEHGANVAIADLRRTDVDGTVSDISRQLAIDRLHAVTCDVADPESVTSMVAEVTEKFGGVDILINNAASKSSDLDAFFASFEEYSLRQWREIMAVNIDGMFLVAQAVGRQMLKQGRGGSIVQVASIYAVVAPDQRIYEGSAYLGRQINTPAVYSTSKAAVIGLSRHLAAHWAGHRIRVNTLTPGGVESGQNEEFQRRYGERVPLGRMAHQDEMSGAVIFLSSDASSYVTGQNLIVDGGLSSW